MSKHPKIKLSEIRRIGWRDWDPIGLGDGEEFGPPNCADEYDRYLLAVVSCLTNSGSRSEATTYLLKVVTESMGMSVVDLQSAQRTVDAIAQYLKELPDSPPIAD